MILKKMIMIICIFVIPILFIDGIAIIHFANQELEQEMKSRIQEKKNNNSDEYSGNMDNKNRNGNEGEIDEIPVNLLILGLDEDMVRSDVIILVNYKPWESTINILSISRDTKVHINGADEKINAMIGMGGEKLLISRIEEITGLPVDYYITIGFLAFRKIVDELGGVEIDVPFHMKYDDPVQNLHINLQKGIQVLNGEKAEEFVRYRKGNNPGQGYIDGDLGRIEAQQKFIKALIQQKFNLRYFSKTDEIFSILKEHARTNISLNDFRYYLRNINKINITNIKAYTLPGDSVYTDNLWYYIYDKDKTAKLIEEKFSR
ncbi:MAG TPA: LCP family protein [Clostridiales bacterium]|nr:LCP family protein [Clostridiales bacterium]